MSAQMTPLSIAPKLFATLLGIAIPSVVFGRSVFAVLIILALITLFFCKPWRDVILDLDAQVKAPVGLLILATFVAWLPNVIISPLPIRSFEAVLRTLLFIGIASVFYSYLRSDQRVLKRTLQAFTIMTAIAMAFSFLAMTILPEIYWFFKLKGWLSTPLLSQLKGFSALTVFMVPILILTGSLYPKAWKIACGFILIPTLIFVYMAGSRSALAGFLAISVIMVFVFTQKSVSKARVVASFASIGLLITGVIVWLQNSRAIWLERAPNQDWFLPVWLLDFERQVIWKHAFEFAMASPWVGIGANTINFAPGADALIERTNNLHVIPAHPHNWAIEIFAETGTIGLCVLLVTLITLTYQTLLTVRRSGSLGPIMAIAVLAGYWGSGLFNFSYWSAWWQLSFLISLVFCFASTPKTEERSLPK